MRIKINKKDVEVTGEQMLIEEIRARGIVVPSMCYMKELESFTSCMLCVVKDARSGKMIPSCSMKPEEGMEILTDDEEVTEARKMALELLLSEHVGDCEAPCQLTCPAHMDIPRMNRHLARGEFAEALQVVKRDIALPAVLGRVCTAPCEGACRRRPMDGAVSICLLKRYAGDADLDSGKSWMPEKLPDTGKNVSVIGAGPAGLAVAWHLVLRGHSIVLYDRHDKAGGSLRRVDEQELPSEVLDREIGLLIKSGIDFRPGIEVDAEMMGKLAGESDAVVVTTGKAPEGEWPMDQAGVFVTGSALKHSRMSIRALGQGKEMAFTVDQYLRGEEPTGEPFMFNSRFGKLLPAEYTEYLKESVAGKRIEPVNAGGGLSREQVMEEAAHCLHCDCRDMDGCKLRALAHEYAASQKRFKVEERALYTKNVQHDLVIYEASKCIRCGICVRLTEKHKEKYGFTFIGRGFDVVVDVPFGEALEKGLSKVATEVAGACPTGAICMK